MRLWDKAGWNGLGFFLSADTDDIINLVFTFNDFDTGAKIFRGWRKSIGIDDAEEKIGLTLITGISRKEPNSYRLVVGVDEDFLRKKCGSKGRMLLVNRIHDMHPKNNQNLNAFLQRYQRAGWYDLVPGKQVAGLPELSPEVLTAV